MAFEFAFGRCVAIHVRIAETIDPRSLGLFAAILNDGITGKIGPGSVTKTDIVNYFDTLKIDRLTVWKQQPIVTWKGSSKAASGEVVPYDARITVERLHAQSDYVDRRSGTSYPSARVEFTIDQAPAGVMEKWKIVCEAARAKRAGEKEQEDVRRAVDEERKRLNPETKTDM